MTVREGLDGTPGSISFESVNYPGYYQRNAGYTFQLNQKGANPSELFKKDASFNQIADEDGSIKFQSVNYPEYLLSHDGLRTKIVHFNNALTDEYPEAQWVPTLLSSALTAECVDGSGVDSYGDGCSWYDAYPSGCGYYDTSSFSADEQCCACHD